MSQRTELALLLNQSKAAIASGDQAARDEAYQALGAFRDALPFDADLALDEAAADAQFWIGAANAGDALDTIGQRLQALAPAGLALDSGTDVAVSGEAGLFLARASQAVSVLQKVVDTGRKVGAAMAGVGGAADLPQALDGMLGDLAGLAGEVQAMVDDPAAEKGPGLANLLTSLRLGLSMFEPIQQTGQAMAGNLDAAAAAALGIDPDGVVQNYTAVKTQLETLIAQVTNTVNQG